LPYIDKERQVVALVEKLCSRFPEKNTEQECHNIALCISILPVSQKSVRALKDNFNFYADKVKYVTVKITFDGILQTARKQFKGENKVRLLLKSVLLLIITLIMK
jgi:condensin complex subunit 1